MISMDQNANNEAQLATFTFPDGKKYDGSVKRTADNNFELSVDDLTEEDWSIVERIEAYAKKEDDKYLFLDNYFAGRSSHEGRISVGNTTFFSPTKTLHTNDPTNPLSLNIMSLSASVDNLDIWFNQSLFSFHNPMHMNDTLDYSLQKKIGEYDFKGLKLSFILSIAGMGFSRLTREVKLKQVAHIGLDTVGQNNVPYLELIEAMQSVERILGLAFKSQIRVNELDVTSQDFTLTLNGEAKPSIFPTYDITLSDIRTASPNVSRQYELSFTHDQIADFQTLLDKWSELEERILPIVDLYLSSASGASTVLENIFLNRIQAIEAFNRSFRTDILAPQDDYDKQKDRIISGFTGPDKKLLKKVLQRGNDFSLEQRLRALDKGLKEKGIWTITVCDFDVIANTRNYYSHYSKDITNICLPEKLIQLTQEVGQMLLALILVELGVEPELVKQSIRRTFIV